MSRCLLEIVGDGAQAAWRHRQQLRQDTSGRFARRDTLMAAHVAHCPKCSQHFQCDIALAIDYLLGAGPHSDDFVDSSDHEAQPPTMEGSFATFIPCLPHEQAHLRATHSRWAEEGVVEHVPSQATSSPSFVVAKRKVKAGQQEAALLWAQQNPVTLAKCLTDPTGYPEDLYDTKLRGVYSLKRPNALIPKPPMRYPRMADAVAQLPPNGMLFVLDFTEGYTSLRLSPEEGSFVCSVHNGSSIRHRSVPFGWRAAPFLFCVLSAILAHELKNSCLPQGSSTTVYVDDILIGLPASVDSTVAIDASLQQLRLFGMRINDSKTQGPAKSVEYIGWQLSVTTRGVLISLPSAKLAASRTWISVVLGSPKTQLLPVRAWDSLLGTLQYAASFTPGAPPYLADLYAARTRAKRGGFEAVQLTDRVLAALNWFQLSLPSTAHLAHPWTPLQYNTKVISFTDSSAEGGLGGLVASPDTVQAFSVFTPESVHWHGNGNSTLLELMAIQQALALVEQSLKCNCGIVQWTIFSDSQAAVALLQRGRSNKSAATNDILRNIFERCAAMQVIVSLQWIAREYNVTADALSHPISSSQTTIPTATELWEQAQTHCPSLQKV